MASETLTRTSPMPAPAVVGWPVRILRSEGLVLLAVALATDPKTRSTQ